MASSYGQSPIQQLHSVIVAEITRHLRYYRSFVVNPSLLENGLGNEQVFNHEVIRRLFYDILQLQPQSIDFIMQEIFSYPAVSEWPLQEILKIVLDVQFIITINNYILARLESENVQGAVISRDVSLCRIGCDQLTKILYENCFFLPQERVTLRLVDEIVSQIDLLNGGKGYVLLVEYKSYMHQHMIQKHMAHKLSSSPLAVKKSIRSSLHSIQSQSFSNNQSLGLNQDSIKEVQNEESEIINGSQGYISNSYIKEQGSYRIERGDGGGYKGDGKDEAEYKGEDYLGFKDKGLSENKGEDQSESKGDDGGYGYIFVNERNNIEATQGASEGWGVEEAKYQEKYAYLDRQKVDLGVDYNEAYQGREKSVSVNGEGYLQLQEYSYVIGDRNPLFGDKDTHNHQSIDDGDSISKKNYDKAVDTDQIKQELEKNNQEMTPYVQEEHSLSGSSTFKDKQLIMRELYGILNNQISQKLQLINNQKDQQNNLSTVQVFKKWIRDHIKKQINMRQYRLKQERKIIDDKKIDRAVERIGGILKGCHQQEQIIRKLIVLSGQQGFKGFHDEMRLYTINRGKFSMTKEELHQCLVDSYMWMVVGGQSEGKFLHSIEQLLNVLYSSHKQFSFKDYLLLINSLGCIETS